MALVQHQGLGAGGMNYTSGAGPVGNTSGSAQQVGGTDGSRKRSRGFNKPSNKLAKGQWKLTPELIAEIQPYLSFDLAKVVQAPQYMQPDQTKYLIRGKDDPTNLRATQNQDLTGAYKSILEIVRSRDNTSIYGTSGNVSGHASQAYYDVYGGHDQRQGGDSVFRPGHNSTFDDSGVAYDATGKPIPLPEDRWGIRESKRNQPGYIPPKASYSQAMARQFQLDHPGYFQVGEDPNRQGTYDRGALNVNDLPASYFQDGGKADPNSLVKFDEKYGYIAPIAIQKRAGNDFLSKYGQYIPLAIFGAAVATSALTGSQAAAPVSEGVASSTAASTAANSTAASTAAGNTAATTAATTATKGGLTAAQLAKAAGTVGSVGSAAGAAGGGGGGGDSGGGYWSQEAAPVYEGVPTSTGPGGGGGGFWSDLGGIAQDYGGTLLSGGSGLLGGGGGGGYAGLLSSLVGAGLSIYQARQVADSMNVQDKSTDFSRTSGGHTSFDPSIRGLQDQSLANTGALERGVMGYGSTFRARSDESKGQYDKLYAELTSNQNPYIQARVNPLKEQIAGSRGQIQRNQGLRGVSGSSFGNDELTNFDFGAQRQIGDAGAMATNDALGARGNTLGSLAGLNQNRLTGETQLTNTLNTLNSNRTGIANDRASLERAGLGLSADSANAAQATEQQKQEMYAQMLQRLLGGTS